MAKSKLPLTPIGGRILVEPESVEETTPSGLVVSAAAKDDKPQKGTVLALGTGKLDKDGKELPWNLKVGDKVFFKQYSPDTVNVEGKDYLLMDESDVLAVFS